MKTEFAVTLKGLTCWYDNIDDLCDMEDFDVRNFANRLCLKTKLGEKEFTYKGAKIAIKNHGSRRNKSTVA